MAFDAGGFHPCNSRIRDLVRDGRPTDDLDYLVWEVCRQVRVEGVTADQVAGIIHDATRHGAVMAPIEAECGEDIAAVFATTSPGRQPPD